MNSVGAVDHLLVIVRTTVGRGFLFPLNGLTHGALLQAHFLDCFRLVSERGVVFPKGLGGFNGFVGGPTILRCYCELGKLNE